MKYQFCLFFLLCGLFLLSSCEIQEIALPTPEMLVEESANPTPAGTLPELIKNLSSDADMVRIVSARALQGYGEDADAAVPALIQNLYARNSDVRWSAVIALGLIGPKAQTAVPDLIIVLETDEVYNVRRASAEALGEIGSSVAIPSLAQSLFDDNGALYMIAVNSAEAIAKITGEEFSDMGGPGYIANEEGIPLIVVDAREWWQAKGQFEDW